jgi:hypothetical protein
MPYEQARAHYELGRHALSIDQRDTQLRSALDDFTRLGAANDLARAEHAFNSLPS